MIALRGRSRKTDRFVAARGSLSVCCIANSPGTFLRTALAPLRDIADEVVIAAGGPIAQGDLDHYAQIADRLFSIEFVFLERHLAWLHAQCRGDWILRLDGDEIPSREMIEAIQRARTEQGVHGVYFARRNLYPTAASYIGQDPWYPDFQLRMVRNDGMLRFSGLLHSGAERVLPSRMVEAPIYHLPFILADLQTRQARAARYEQLRPGLLAPTGLPAERLELPEGLAGVLTAPVPDEDRKAIEAVLAAELPPARSARASPVSLTLSDALWAGRDVPESAYAARAEPIGLLAPLAPSERRDIYVRVHNDGTEAWGWDPSIGPFIHMVHRVLGEDGAPVGEWRPSFFPESVQPGTATVVPATLDAPDRHGHYRLEVRVRHAPDRVFGTCSERELLVRDRGAWG